MWIKILLLLASLDLMAASQSGEPRAVDLFPATVISDLKETELLAKQVETDLEKSIYDLEKQSQMYNQLDCSGQSDDDPGCAAIRQQIAQSYREMVGVLARELPNMKKKIKRAQSSLESRLSTMIGGAMTGQSLQENLVASTQSQTKVPSAYRGRGGMRLSQRFQQYYNLISSSRTTNKNTLTMLAANMYIDMTDSLAFIDMINNQILHDGVILDLDTEVGYVTPEMQEAVAGVKTILFGEDLSVSEPAPDPIAREGASKGYRSPFEK